ncbi:hypothetical protein [Sorangium sp. So ce363]|uniref:hypothetical protein n=1 Tax=Sorangium sp. So ce363 TaxID=3133304 RepID=UPI003F631533
MIYRDCIRGDSMTYRSVIAALFAISASLGFAGVASAKDPVEGGGKERDCEGRRCPSEPSYGPPLVHGPSAEQALSCGGIAVWETACYATCYAASGPLGLFICGPGCKHPADQARHNIGGC